MRTYIHTLFLFLFTSLLSFQDISAQEFPGAIIIDHTYNDLAGIPIDWIDSVQNHIKLHYAGRSHATQLMVGLQRIESSNGIYDVEILNHSLPTSNDALCILNGNYMAQHMLLQLISGIALVE